MAIVNITSRSTVSAAACESRVRGVVASIILAHRRGVATALGAAALAFAPPALFADPVSAEAPAAEAAAAESVVPAGATEAALAEAAAAGPLSEVTVTGTRIARQGYYAPTPVSIISTEEMACAAVPHRPAAQVRSVPALPASAP
jgi:hypothetical protein